MFRLLCLRKVPSRQIRGNGLRRGNLVKQMVVLSSCHAEAGMLRALLSILCLCAVAVAQAPGASSARNEDAYATSARNLTIRGCVAGDKRYSFTQASTGTI